MSEPLRLIALDEEDLAVISAHLQDAVIKIRDMAFLPQTKRFALLAARFDWAGIEKGKMQRCYTGLHFEAVQKAALTGFEQSAGETCLNLLSIHFTAHDAPAGDVILTFSGGAAVKLSVECLEAQMRDMCTPWPAKAQPGHAIDESPGENAKTEELK
jgi:hypothetical protein